MTTFAVSYRKVPNSRIARSQRQADVRKNLPQPPPLSRRIKLGTPRLSSCLRNITETDWIDFVQSEKAGHQSRSPPYETQGTNAIQIGKQIHETKAGPPRPPADLVSPLHQDYGINILHTRSAHRMSNGFIFFQKVVSGFFVIR